jgi:hypothetical protein
LSESREKTEETIELSIKENEKLVNCWIDDQEYYPTSEDYDGELKLSNRLQLETN